MTKDLAFFFGKSPQQLLRLITVLSAISSLLVLLFFAYASARIFERYVIQAAELDSVALSHLILALDRDLLMQPNELGDSQLQVHASRFDELDQALLPALIPYDILKIKVFDRRGTIRYSSDRDIIGSRDAYNPRLENALAGHNDSALQTKDQFFDLENGARFDVDVVETYVPIINESGQVVGSFEIYRDTTPFRDSVLQGVALSVGILAVILLCVFIVTYQVVKGAIARLSIAQLELEHQATIDALTGLNNRREILLKAQKEYSRYVREREAGVIQPLGLIMIDIDYFKRINDEHGHPAGDAVLCRVAERMAEQLRGYSAIGRYGGEEFLVLLPGTDRQDTQQVAKRISEVVKGTPVVHKGVNHCITLSMGVTWIREDEVSFDTALTRADDALLAAKQTGRDRVVIVN